MDGSNMDSIHLIEPGRLYSFSEAARLIPSPRGEHTHRKTLHRFRLQGRIAGVPRHVNGLTYWFVYGSELLRFLAADQCPEWIGRTPAQREKAIAQAERHIEQLAPRTRERRRRTDASEHESQARPASRPCRPHDGEPDEPPGEGV